MSIFWLFIQDSSMGPYNVNVTENVMEGNYKRS